MKNTPDFEAIRAYTDADLAMVLRRLFRDKNLFDMLAGYRLARLHSLAPMLARWLLRLVFHYKLWGVTSIFEFQERITGYYFFHMLESSVDDFAISGLENLPATGGALLVSNHRDIVLDPTFVDYSLYRRRRITARLATGDNLTSIPFAADLMRLNKSFWVIRNEKSPRKILQNASTLALYIRHSIEEDQEMVWLAQREGRAKNGLDATEVAVLKMLKLAYREHSWQKMFARLKPLPVSIAYEYDPCDAEKATELVIKHRTGKQHKDDTRSVATSITRPKGRVSIHFGAALDLPKDATPEAIAQAFDRAITTGYRLFPSNLTALAALQAQPLEPTVAEILQTDSDQLQGAFRWFTAKGTMPAKDQQIIDRAARIKSQEIRQTLLGIYANPCLALWRLHTQSTAGIGIDANAMPGGPGTVT